MSKGITPEALRSSGKSFSFSRAQFSFSALKAKVSGWLSEVDLRGYGTAYDAFARGDMTYANRLSEITCPLLALTGSGDQNSSPAMARAMADAAPLGRALVIEGHRHMVNLTAKDAVNTALQDWLEIEHVVAAQ